MHLFRISSDFLIYFEFGGIMVIFWAKPFKNPF